MHLPGLTTTVHLNARGRRPAAEVWERYADPALWSSWSPQIRRVALDGGARRIGAGVTGRVWSYAPIPVHFRVDAVEETARTWAWTVRLGPVRLHLEHGVEAGALKTLTSLSLSGPTPVVLGYAPLARLALRNLVR